MSDEEHNGEVPTLEPELPTDAEVAVNTANQLAEHAEHPELVERLANLAVAARSATLQSFFDALSDETQADLVRADDRSALGLWIERYNPSLDWKNINVPKAGLRGVFHTLALCGIIDVKPEMEAKMRALPGSAIFDIPYAKEVSTLLGEPELAAFFEAGKITKDSGAGLAEKVRARVKELTGQNPVGTTQEIEHEEVAHATPNDVVAPHNPEAPESL